MYRALNEDTTFDTIMSLAKGTSDIVSDIGNTDRKYSYSSIAKAASALVAVFPVLTSRTVSPDTAQNISKFIEQKACNLFTLALQQANISNAENGIEYLRNFHRNLDVGGNGVDTVIKTMQAWIDAFNDGSTFNEAGSMSLNMYNDLKSNKYYDDLLEADDIEISSSDINKILEIMSKNANIKVYDTNLNEASINDYMISESNFGNYHISIKPMSINEARAANDPEERLSRPKKYRDQFDKMVNQGYDPDSALMRVENTYQTERNNIIADRNYDRLHGKPSDEDIKNSQNEEEVHKARLASGKNVNILRDQDIKKMNDAVPSLLEVRFYQSTTAQVATTFIMGVKSKMIPITTDEVLRRIMNDNKDGKKFLKFMRLITGELKVSEVLFGISRIKDDLKSCRVKGAYGDTWNLLKNRADAARTQLKLGQKNDYSAITTVLISKADADELFREENFDITDPKNALHFMESYNLMAFGIADDSIETFKILFDDNSKIFEEISYNMLERESKDGTYKKLINLMAASK